MISSLLQKTSEHNVNGNQSSYPLYIHVNPIFHLKEMTEIQTYYLAMWHSLSSVSPNINSNELSHLISPLKKCHLVCCQCLSKLTRCHLATWLLESQLSLQLWSQLLDWIFMILCLQCLAPNWLEFSPHICEDPQWTVDTRPAPSDRGALVPLLPPQWKATALHLVWTIFCHTEYINI